MDLLFLWLVFSALNWKVILSDEPTGSKRIVGHDARLKVVLLSSATARTFLGGVWAGGMEQ